MTLFDLPLQPLQDGRHELFVNHHTVLTFPTRHAALAHALAEAADRSRHGLATSISVEGGDGVWRLVPL